MACAYEIQSAARTTGGITAERLQRGRTNVTQKPDLRDVAARQPQASGATP